jgi:pyrimidine deaminase RibD-like protein
MSDIAFMKYAIKQARQCKAEDDRPRPLVGAVAVRDGDILDSCYRGELAPGEHAEFSLLERKLKEVRLAGTTIFTTLEPCTTRNHPKLPCVDRLIERKIKKVVIGQLDPNPSISGKGVLRLRQATLKSKCFPVTWQQSWKN